MTTLTTIRIGSVTPLWVTTKNDVASGLAPDDRIEIHNDHRI